MSPSITSTRRIRPCVLWSAIAMLSGVVLAPTLSHAQGVGEPIVDAPEMTEQTAKAIQRGLDYLISIQKPDGSWSSPNGDYAVAGTSLGLMAFMVEGHFPGLGPYGEALDRAKDHLIKRAKDSESGAMGVKMYEVGLFTIAMSELWGMTADPEDNKVIQEILERAVGVILQSQSPLGGWRYDPRPTAGQDTSVTATVFVSLASAREAGILIPNESIDQLVSYLRSVWSDKTGGFGYMTPGYSLACTAGGAYSAQLAGHRDAEWVTAALDALEADTKGFKDTKYFYYSHYYAMQAMVQGGDDRYAKWYPRIRDELLARQNANGSWQADDEHYPHKTSMAIIILGTPNRYIPVYQR